MATVQWTPKTKETGEARTEQVTAGPRVGTPDNSREVVVLHTTTTDTIEALKIAAGLARGLRARIRLLVPQIVPDPLALTSPQITTDFTERRIRDLTSNVGIETRIDVRLCRDQWVMLVSALQPRSFVVLGGGHSLGPTCESRLAERLSRLGHQVYFCSLE